MYENRPEVFELVVSECFFESVDSRHFYTPFGPSEQKYCYFNGVLIGELTGSASRNAAYYRGLNISYDNRKVITLLPLLQSNEYLEFPEYREFFTALRALLDCVNIEALVCEAYCDEKEFEQSVDLGEVLRRLEAFSIGESTVCPTFVFRNKNHIDG